MSSPNPYESIAQEYKASKQLPFRTHIEAYTLFELLGDVTGLSVLELACGEGFYTRQIRKAGAATIIGIDLSPAMIALAREEEERSPLGCEYDVGDATKLAKPEKYDVVFGAYLLNYASSPEMLKDFAMSIFNHLKPGGRFIGINDNPAQDPSTYGSGTPYGFSKSTTPDRQEGDPITWTLQTPDGETFAFDNYYLAPDTVASVFESVGFKRFSWEGPWLAPDAEPGFWGSFMANPPIIGVFAER